MAGADGGKQLDASLRNTADERVWLSRFRGRPVVLIYETRHTTEVNRAFKEALRERGTALGLSEAVAVVAVANVAEYNFFPARGFALNGVRDAERKAQLPIWVDWEDTLTRAPWNLPKADSTVLVLTGSGEVAFQHSGPLSPELRDDAFAVLRDLLQPGDATAANAE